ncbi:hypothetical protein NUU61_000342 [Penicillium alfredii]|uniref:Hemimethylated DNA-binding domain-containing protein n=1 Tax=Penicillium alfredii TaxID=1506179 RepID=A0A9W9KQZ6_9EURO|nr:uncharacterized protein NUU61_000342 [Penicillium alfredii]KAJ5114583.1 hypothetical protein NUU61_000342 [Penicillium alfredii]
MPLPPRSSTALEQSSSRFHDVTNEPLLWRYYCQSYYKSWDKRHDISSKLASPVSSVDWKALFVLRYRVDLSITRLLDSILASQTGRIEKFRAVIDFGYDAKDTLLRHCRVESGEDHLARSIAVPEWVKLRRGEAVSLDRVLGAFDLFIPESGYGDLDEIKMALDRIVSRFLASQSDVSLTPREKALAIASWLHANDLTGIKPGREYHSLGHNFLGNWVWMPALCGFPLHVHVIITPQLGFDMDGNALGNKNMGLPMYLDPFRGARETLVADLRDQLRFLGASNVENSTFLGESLASEIVLRCGKNILNSIRSVSHQSNTHFTSVDIVSARYAALWSSILLSGDSRPIELRHQLPWLMELFATDFPSDIFLVEQYIVPLFHDLFEYEHILKTLHVMRAADKIPKQVRRRTGENSNIRYRVGQVFRHRRYHYHAIITGWDSECGAGEQWMRRMGIDRLQAGRHQSFYHVLVEDRSVRYVAEENIQLTVPHLAELPHNLTAIAGKHFKRWDQEVRAFVSNVRDEYPDD